MRAHGPLSPGVLLAVALGVLLVLDGVAEMVWFLQGLLMPTHPGIKAPGTVVSLLAEVGLTLWLLVRGVATSAPGVQRPRRPEVVDAGTVTGSADAIVHMRSRDIPSLEIALEKVRIAPNVDHTRSAIVLSRFIHRTHD